MEIYRRYISVIWGYSGLRYRDLSIIEISVVALGVASVAAFMPIRIARPSSLVLWLMFTFVYVPTMALTFMVGYQEWETYLGSLLAMTAAFLGACVLTQRPIQGEPKAAAAPGRNFRTWMLVAGVVMTAALYLRFGSIMSFANIDEIYTQRFAASDLGRGYIAYVSTYHSHVVAAALIALGLVARHRVCLAAGVGLFIFGYAINAQKISLATPFIMAAIYLAVSRTRNLTIYYTLGMSALIFVAYLWGVRSEKTSFAAALLLTRAVAVPAQTFGQYYDFFDKMGHTWWSNVKGISLIVPPPEAFASDPYWPKLGILVGREYHGTVLQNSNANLFVGEGVAAAGMWGVVVIGVAWAIWLRVLDIAAGGWDRAFVLLAITPAALALTNGHLSTVLLSFGGFFWLALFALYKPRT